MSMLLMVKAMQLQVGNPNRKLVLLKLADNASDSGECWPSYQHVADQCEMGRRTVMRHIKQLEKDGYLRIEHRRKSATENLTNIYVLTLDSVGGGSVTESPGVVSQSHQGGVTESLGGSVTESLRTSHSFEPVIEPKKNKQKKAVAKKPKAKFTPPTFQQVRDYALERNRPDLAKKFFDFYEAGDWKDTRGNQVKNWKQKFITWESSNSNPNQHGGLSHGNGSQQSGSVGRNETESQRRFREHRAANRPG